LPAKIDKSIADFVVWNEIEAWFAAGAEVLSYIASWGSWYDGSLSHVDSWSSWYHSSHEFNKEDFLITDQRSYSHIAEYVSLPFQDKIRL
jgi:hypothetical protein